MRATERWRRSQKQYGAPGKTGPAIFALYVSEDRCSGASPKQIRLKNQNPQNGHLMARFDWGSGAVCFGASPVAAVFGSAPGSATSPEHRIHFKPALPAVPLKQDISTLLGIGHFYFALTGNSAPPRDQGATTGYGCAFRRTKGARTTASAFERYDGRFRTNRRRGWTRLRRSSRHV